MTRPRPKVLLAMSGGVDSSVAAAILLREGYEVVGCFMRLGSPGESFDLLERDDGACAAPAAGLRIGHHGCCSVNDAADARAVAARLDVPFYVCNFKKDFGRVIDYFVDEYNAGRTPNPCVRCNDWLKFGKLHEYAKQIGAGYVASGHYARIDRAAAGPRLLRGVDHDKDQSYVLFGAPRARLAEMLLPIGAMEKPAVRALAASLGLPVADKPDSQEICFVPDQDYAGLVGRRAPGAIAPGRILDAEGAAIGDHEGHQRYTIGQRRGIGLATGRPLYVIDKDASANTITVGPREATMAAGCIAGGANWLVGEPAEGVAIPCTAQIRAHAAPAPATLRRRGEREIEVRFDEPQHAVAPGQAVVCYDGEVVLGGGWIESALPLTAPAAPAAPRPRAR